MIWSQRHRDELPPGLVLTCGGWFGHIVGDEKRAPRVLRRSGLEWIARVAQAPTRLAPRYARGAGATAILALSTLQRRSPSSGP
jgi:UDP-N-acetyl-D-mannosaminuronic acid transferase (WecB/TagA/CpsF family)